MNAFLTGLVLLPALLSVSSQAEVTLLALQNKKSVQLSWFWIDETPPRAVILKTQCAGAKAWKPLHVGTIPLSAEAGKDLSYLPEAQQRIARAAFEEALEKKNLQKPLSTDSLLKLFDSPDGQFLAAMLFSQNVPLAMYIGGAFVDSAPRKGCSYGLFRMGEIEPRVSARAVIPTLKLSNPKLDSQMIFMDQVKLTWKAKYGANTPNSMVGFSAYVLDSVGHHGVALFEDVKCMVLGDAKDCGYSANLSAFGKRKVTVSLEAVIPGFKVPDKAVFKFWVPLTADQIASMQTRLEVSKENTKIITWNVSHSFGDSIPFDSTQVDIFPESGGDAKWRKGYKGLRTQGSIPVQAWMQTDGIGSTGMTWNLEVTHFGPLGRWSKRESFHVSAPIK